MVGTLYMKKFNKILCVALSFLFIGVTLSGCALFQRDDAYYYNQVVARVGSDITINKRQLMEAFNNFGYQYVSQNQMKLSDAYDQTLNTLIDREIAVRLSVSIYGGGGSDSTGLLKVYMPDATTSDKMVTAATEYEAADARKTAFDYMTSQFQTLDKQVRKDKKWADDNPDANSTPASTADSTSDSTDSKKPAVYTPFDKYLVQQNGKYVINLDKYKDIPAVGYIPKTNEEFVDRLLMPRGSNSTLEQSIASETFNRYIRSLQNSQKGMGLKYNTDAEKKQAVIEELKRVEIETEKNSVVNRLQTAFNLGLVGGLARADDPNNLDGEGNVITNVTYDYNTLMDLQRTDFPAFKQEVEKNNQAYVDNLVRIARTSFRDKITTARWRYDTEFDDDASYTAKLLDSFSSLYFVPRNVAGQFFTVSQILISYTADQKTQLTAITDKYNQDKNTANRDNALALLRSQVTVVPNVNGTKEGDPMTAQQVLDYVKDYVAPYSQTKSLDRKLQDFRDMIYMFNDDPGMLNPSFEYVIGIDKRTDKSENSTETDNMSRMVPQFTAAARSLYNYNYDTNQGGLMTEADYVKTFGQSSNIFNYYDSAHNKDVAYEPNKLVSTLGTMSGITWTDYGAEILIYTRNISDILFTNTKELIDSQIDQFLNVTQTSYGNKTYFDAEVDAITKPAYTSYENKLLTDYKGQTDAKGRIINVIKLYKSKYKDLTKSR